jgi:predicted dehydrogenase
VATIGVGIVGLDHWYNVLPLLEQLKTVDGFQVVMLSDNDAERAKAHAAAVGAEWTTDAARVINDPRVQLVAVFSSTDRSAAWSIAAAQSGKHVLANKPMAMNLTEATKVVEEVERAGTFYFPYESYARLTPLYQNMKTWIAEGRIGEIQTIYCSHEASIPVEWMDSEEPGWWTKKDRSPGGGWIDHAIYQIDLIRWLSGAEVIRSDGQIGNIKYKFLDVEDFGTATLLLSNGVVATSEAHWLSPKSAFRRVVEIVGSEGVILFDSTDDRLRVNGHFWQDEEGGESSGLTRIGGKWQNTPIPQQKGAILLDHVRQVVSGEVQPIAGAFEARVNLRVCLDFYQSAITIT